MNKRLPPIMARFLKLSLAIVLSICPIRASAFDLSEEFTFDGTLVNDVTSAPITGAVSLVFEVYDSSGLCLLFQESQSVTADSQGQFSARVGTGTRASPATDGGLLFRNIFQNTNLVRSVGANCPAGYTPAAGDSRRLRVTVNGTVLTPDFNMAPVPMAHVAESLQGKVPSDFVSVTGGNMTGPLQLNAQNEARFADNDSSNYVGFRAPLAVGTNRIWTLPANDGTVGQFLSTDGAGNLGWSTAGGGGITSLNSLTAGSQNLLTSFNHPILSPDWNSAGSNHTLRFPMAASLGTSAGLLSNWDFASFNSRIRSTGDTMSGGLNMGGNTISNAATPTAANDVATKGYVDAGLGGKQSALGFTPVNKAGDTMTGSLSLGSNRVTSLGNPIAATDAVNYQTVSSAVSAVANNYVLKSGDSMTGSLSLGSNRVTSLGNPIAATDAVNYQTVSSAVSAVANSYVLKSGDSMMGALLVNGNVVVSGARALRFGDSDDSNYLNLRSPATLGANFDLTLPSNAGVSGSVMASDGSGNLNWMTLGSGLTSLNGLNGSAQNLGVQIGTASTAPGWGTSGGSTHNFYLPYASGAGVTGGLLSQSMYNLFVQAYAHSTQASNLFVSKTGDTMTGSLSLGSNRVTSLGNPIAATDAVNYQTVSSAVSAVANNYVLKSGDSMTGSLAVNSNVVVSSAYALRLADSDNSNFINLRSPTSLGSNIELTLPSNLGANGQVLQTDGVGNSIWATVPHLGITENVGSVRTTLGLNTAAWGGVQHVAIGYGAGSTYTGNYSVFVGTQAGNSGGTGSSNIAIGDYSGSGTPMNGGGNTLVGSNTTLNNSGATGNVLLGALASSWGNYNISIGQNAQVSGDGGIAIGRYASAAANSISIGTYDGTGFRQRISADATGRVGIGTHVPTSKLTVQGDLSVSGPVITDATPANFVNSAGPCTSIDACIVHSNQSSLMVVNAAVPGTNLSCIWKDAATKTGQHLYVAFTNSTVGSILLKNNYASCSGNYGKIIWNTNISPSSVPPGGFWNLHFIWDGTAWRLFSVM